VTHPIEHRTVSPQTYSIYIPPQDSWAHNRWWYFRENCLRNLKDLRQNVPNRRKMKLVNMQECNTLNRWSNVSIRQWIGKSVKIDVKND